MGQARKFTIFNLTPPNFFPDHQARLWRFHRPDVTSMLNVFESRERWVANARGAKLFRAISDLMVLMTEHDELDPLIIEQAVMILAQLSYKQAIYALAWLDEHSMHSFHILSWAANNRATNPSANVVYQRVMQMRGQQILDDLVAEQTKDLG